MRYVARWKVINVLKGNEAGKGTGKCLIGQVALQQQGQRKPHGEGDI